MEKLSNEIRGAMTNELKLIGCPYNFTKQTDKFLQEIFVREIFDDNQKMIIGKKWKLINIDGVNLAR